MDAPAPKPGQPQDDAQRGPRGYGSYGNYGNYGGPAGGYGAGGYGAYGNYGAYGSSGAKASPFTVYLTLLRERWWWVLMSILVFVTVAIVFTSSIVPEYRAAGRLRVYRLTPNLGNNNSAVEEAQRIGSNDDFLTAIESMKSSTVIEGVSRLLTPAERKLVLEPYQQGNVFTGPLTEQEVFGRQRAINPTRQTFVVNVEFTHPNRELARMVAQRFCDVIQKSSEDERLTMTHPLVEKARIEIESLEDKVRRLYEKKNGLVKSGELLDIAGTTNSIAAQRAKLIQDREEYRKQVDEVGIVVALVKQYRVAGRDLAEIPLVRADVEVTNARNKVAEETAKTRAMEEIYTDLHPKMINQRQVLAQCVVEFKRSVNTKADSMQTTLLDLQAKLANSVEILRQKDEAINKLQAAAVELEKIDKDIRANEEFLGRMKLNYEEAKLRTATSGISTSIRVMDKPSVSDKPVNKNFTFNALAGLLLGLFSGVGLVVLMGMLDDRIKSVKDIEAGLGVQVLGTVPKVAETTGPDRALLARQDKDRLATESVRAIYSAMKINPATAAGRVFLVTSTRPGEGKTFVATNLALTFAQHSERVIVVDADLRLPNVGPSLGFAGDGGVSRWYNGEMTLDEAIVKDVAPGLDVLPVGMSCRNPTQVINNPKFAEMIDELRRRYDRVFIDSPPIGAVSDALHLIPKADGVVYVVRFNVVSARNAAACIGRLREAGVPMLCAVLNQMSVRMASVYTDTYDPTAGKYYASDAGGPPSP
jgi:capsular exopolysaccharide synthesis family protein